MVNTTYPFSSQRSIRGNTDRTYRSGSRSRLCQISQAWDCVTAHKIGLNNSNPGVAGGELMVQDASTSGNGISYGGFDKSATPHSGQRERTSYHRRHTKKHRLSRPTFFLTISD